MNGGGLRQELREDFDIYDQAVDIVSCWEAFGEYAYGNEFDSFFFDRSPSIPNDPDPLTPDFTMLVNREYGIIGEVKRTLPENREAFTSTLSQLNNYCGSHTLSSPEGRIEPETCDVLLLISATDASQIGTRLQNLIDEDEFSFDCNVVLMRYQYNTMDTMSRYEFVRITEYESEFRDEPLPNEISLNSEVGPEGNYGTMKLYPKHFTPYKVQTPICNDDPPGQYLATILWHKIFPQYLSSEQYAQWREGTAQKTIEIQKGVDELTQDLNEYLHDGNVNPNWVQEALDFLDTANLADRLENGYRIKFRGIVRDVGENNPQQGTQDLEQMSELASIFISRYAQYSPEGDEVPGQTSIEQF